MHFNFHTEWLCFRFLSTKFCASRISFPLSVLSTTISFPLSVFSLPVLCFLLKLQCCRSQCLLVDFLPSVPNWFHQQKIRSQWMISISLMSNGICSKLVSSAKDKVSVDDLDLSNFKRTASKARWKSSVFKNCLSRTLLLDVVGCGSPQNIWKRLRRYFLFYSKSLALLRFLQTYDAFLHF